MEKCKKHKNNNNYDCPDCCNYIMMGMENVYNQEVKEQRLRDLEEKKRLPSN